MILRVKAPLRISFGEGGTDVSPYPQQRGGAGLSATIDRYAYSTLITQNSSADKVRSLGYNVELTYNFGDTLEYDGNLDLIKAALKLMEINQAFDLCEEENQRQSKGVLTSPRLKLPDFKFENSGICILSKS